MIRTDTAPINSRIYMKYLFVSLARSLEEQIRKVRWGWTKSLRLRDDEVIPSVLFDVSRILVLREERNTQSKSAGIERSELRVSRILPGDSTLSCITVSTPFGGSATRGIPSPNWSVKYGLNLRESAVGLVADAEMGVSEAELFISSAFMFNLSSTPVRTLTARFASLQSSITSDQIVLDFPMALNLTSSGTMQV